MYDIAIIGNGASAVAVLKTLVLLSKKKNQLVNICVVGKTSTIGFGMAYSEDDDCAIMNTPASNVSIDFEEALGFINWSLKNGYRFLEHDNVPRHVYGKYLHDMAMELGNNCNVTLSDAYAVDIEDNDDSYKIFTLQGKEILTQYIILCTGVSKMDDLYGLSCFDNYIANPYPLHQKLSRINKSDSILVLGSGLTAVDICVYLFWQAHNGKIILCSRQGRLPAVKSIIKPYIPKWCRFEFFIKMYELQGNLLSLRQILRILRRELKSVGANWIDVLFPKDSDSAATFIAKTEAGRMDQPWLNVLVGVQHEIDLAWAYVKTEDKKLFIKKYLPDVLRIIAPIPLKNAYILCKLFSENRLQIISGVNMVKNDRVNFIINRKDNVSLKVDHVINAIGPNRHISLVEDDLVSNLLKKSLVHPNPSGGIQVCPKTGRVISKSNKIFSVGHLTNGEHPLINNIEFIVMNAKATAETIMNDMKYKVIKSETVNDEVYGI